MILEVGWVIKSNYSVGTPCPETFCIFQHLMCYQWKLGHIHHVRILCTTHFLGESFELLWFQAFLLPSSNNFVYSDGHPTSSRLHLIKLYNQLPAKAVSIIFHYLYLTSVTILHLLAEFIREPSSFALISYEWSLLIIIWANAIRLSVWSLLKGWITSIL